jgi:uncharacterized protein (TIGR03083 family)
VSNEPSVWVAALRNSHDRVAALAAGLDASAVQQPSKCSEWSIAQVYSHLGSAAEIFGLFLDAGLTGAEAPDREAFPKIWDRWNALSPSEQTVDGTAADETFVERLESSSSDSLGSLRLAMFGMDLDAVALLRMRLSEHAVHTWDIAAALDPAEPVAAEAVDLLIDGLGQAAGRGGRAIEGGPTLAIETTGPERRFALDTSGVTLEKLSEQPTSGSIRLPAEVLLRVVYGRSSAADDGSIEVEDFSADDLRAMFPGF